MNVPDDIYRVIARVRSDATLPEAMRGYVGDADDAMRLADEVERLEENLRKCWELQEKNWAFQDQMKAEVERLEAVLEKTRGGKWFIPWRCR